MKLYYSTSIFVLLLFAAVPFLFAQTSAHPGIDQYLAGKDREAITSLSTAVKQKEFENNDEIWNYLGLAYVRTMEFERAKQSFETAVKLSPNKSRYRANLAYVYLLLRQTSKAESESKKAIELDPMNMTAYYLRGSANLWTNQPDDAERDADQMMLLDPFYPQGYILKSNVLLMRLGRKVMNGAAVKDEISLLKEASDILKVGLEKCAKCPNRKLLEQESESVNVFLTFFSKDLVDVSQPNAIPAPGVTPLRIISKPRAGYTEAARMANVQGKITIAVLFSANGKVTHTMLLKRLGYGLDEQTVWAAQGIRFEPQSNDGKPVSVVKIMEYGFSIY